MKILIYNEEGQLVKILEAETYDFKDGWNDWRGEFIQDAIVEVAQEDYQGSIT